MPRHYTPADIQRFASKVQTSDSCHLYVGGLFENGYGAFWLKSIERNMGAHVAAWEMAYGPVPKGLYVLHQCDNKQCVRLEHLHLGTPLKNMQERSERGRLDLANCAPKDPSRGEARYNAKWTEDEIRMVRDRYANGISQSAIAREYKTKQSVIYKIVRRESWKHVT